MPKRGEFLTEQEEAEIVAAIKQAEKNTSGEIRVHIENSTDEDPLIHAEEVFHTLEMDNTEARNGVLIYIAVESRVFVIFGDKGISSKVPEGFWDSTRDIMLEHFKKNDFKTGIVMGIEQAGEQLQKYFPWKKGDKNELPDEISKS